ncbi:hypothetical protein SEUCBS139899_008035 [Sporothrix eucalyptigena]
MTTSGAFRYADPATIVDSDVPFVKPWAKVDTDATSYARYEKTLPVGNVRDAPAGDFAVDRSGFALFHAPAEEKLFTDEEAIRSGYYAEVEALVRAKLSTPQEPVSKVVIFDHTVRRRNPQAPRQPVQQVHVDQTPGAAEVRVRRHAGTPEEVEKLLKGRYQIINVWRPIGYAAVDHPLAFIDYRTAKLNDLKKVDLLYPNQPGSADVEVDVRGKEVLPDPTKASSTDGYSIKGETYTVVPNDTHKFYYVKDMTPEEALFIKCFDSRSEVQPNVGRPGVSAWTPHTAFTDPATPADAKGRQSIEVRCLVFYGEGEQ